jgi:archaemetzincin
MDIRNITLVTFGYFGDEILKKIAIEIKKEFFLNVTFKEGHIDLSECYDPVRRQYNGTKLLREVDVLYSSDSAKTIGLFNVDLFIPIMTFIFGQAYLSGRAAIASQYRLSNERYGMIADEKLILERFQKEIIHELGHTFGLIHCHISTCVMRSSTYVEDIDQKNKSLCISCRESVNSLFES